MTSPLSWTIHGNDQLSGVLEKLDRTLSQLSRKLDAVTGDARQMGAAFGTAEGQTKRLASSAEHASGRLDALGGRLSSVASQVAQYGAAFAAAAAVATAAVASIGVKTAAANEQAMISFELLLGNTEKAISFLADLQKFAAATPFEMPQLRTAASRLLAVGVQARDIIPLLTALGDATAGMGTGAEGIERAVTALSQMQMKTKVTAEEMLQLTEAGIPAWQALAAVLRVDVATAMKMVERREVDAGKVFEAVQSKAGSAMQRLDGMMERQSSTLAGMWSTFQDNASQALAKFVEPLMPSMKKVLDWLGTNLPKGLDKIRALASDPAVKEWLTKLGGDLKKIGEQILPVAESAFNFFADAIKDNKDTIAVALKGIATAIGLIVVGLLALGGVAVRVAGFIHEAFKVILKAVLAVLDFLVNAAAVAFEWVPELGPKLKTAADEFGVFRDRVNAALDGIEDEVVIIKAIMGGALAGASVGGEQLNLNLGRRAAGGPVWPGEVYTWQHLGEERLMVGSSGRVMSNQEVRAADSRSGAGGVVGVLRVVHETPDGKVIREELLELKRQRGLPSLGLA